MYLMKRFTIGNAISTVLDMLSLNAQTGQAQGNRANNLRFHAVHGKSIALHDNFSDARRDENHFEHSVVFSNRPINVEEVIAVEIKEISREFHGPLRIGFTSCNPLVFQNDVVPLGRDLKNSVGFWIKSVLLFPLHVGSVIYFKVDPDGTVLYGVDGKNGGIFLKNIDVSHRLWVVLEAYGSVQSFSFVNKSMLLEDCDCDKDDSVNVTPTVNENVSIYPSTSSNGGGPPLRRVALSSFNTPLAVRRNIRLTSLKILTSAHPNTSLSPSPSHTPFKSPLPLEQFNLGLCIVCTDREKNTAFTNCGHLCMCFDCAEAFKTHRSPNARTRRQKNLCPICRQPIVSLLRVYT